MLDHHGDRQAALHFELRIKSGLRLFQAAFGNIGGEDIEIEARIEHFRLVHQHGERIRFLAGRAGGAPDLDVAAEARFGQSRQDIALELVERNLVAEKEGLVGGHRIGDGGHQLFVALGAQGGEQGGDIGEAFAAGHWRQTGLDQIGLVRAEDQA